MQEKSLGFAGFGGIFTFCASVSMSIFLLGFIHITAICFTAVVKILVIWHFVQFKKVCNKLGNSLYVTVENKWANVNGAGAHWRLWWTYMHKYTNPFYKGNNWQSNKIPKEEGNPSIVHIFLSERFNIRFQI